ncbi:MULTISPECIES: iron uptake porin [Oscillatoriales]|uniref:iron uptake porin n=1 Tax=Oscillatoriales TaxID=1150 RepID=UPI000291FBA4|nr:membrane protein [Arthrospira platensis str. Paraca]MDT9312888.1 iron uptake porin [Limnospira sp. Paracas R14]
MSKRSLNLWLLSPAVLGASLLASLPAVAEISATETGETELTTNNAITIASIEDVTADLPQQLAQVPVNPHAGGAFSQANSVVGKAYQEIPLADLDAPNANGNTLNQLNQYGREGQSRRQSQVTSVSQLSDVQPTDWAFQALQSLVERYGCIAGYPDGTFRGNRALTRFEFAAGVNACLERVNELINAATADLVTREDLAKMQRLMEEFAAELASIRGRVTVLEARTAELEANQFSTTTKLHGEVVFWPGDSFGDRARHNVAGGPFSRRNSDPTQTYLGYRVRLDFDTSFTGRDLLKTRLQVYDNPNLSDFDLTNSLMARTPFDGTSNGVELDDLYYRFPAFNNRAQIFIGANSLDLDDTMEVLTPFNSDGTGSISMFGQRNPAIFRGPEGAGLGANFAFGDRDRYRLNLSYLAGNASDATAGNGLFNGSNTASAQFVFEPTEKLGFAVEYARKYFTNGGVEVAGGTGSWIADRPFGDNATTSDNLGLQFNWRLANSFQLGGWFGATWANQQNNGSDSATILNWAVTLGFPDLLREGDTGALIVGMPPKVTNHDRPSLENSDTSLHIEAFYHFPFSEYISITPGGYFITNPGHNDRNATIFVGTLRTTFQF